MNLRNLAALLAALTLAACGVDGTPQSGGSSAAPAAPEQSQEAPKSEPESSKGEEKKAD